MAVMLLNAFFDYFKSLFEALSQAVACLFLARQLSALLNVIQHSNLVNLHRH